MFAFPKNPRNSVSNVFSNLKISNLSYLLITYLRKTSMYMIANINKHIIGRTIIPNKINPYNTANQVTVPNIIFI